MLLIYFSLFVLINAFTRPPELLYDLLSTHYYLVIENSYCKILNKSTISFLGLSYNETTLISSIHHTSLIPNDRLDCPIEFGSHYSSCDGYRTKILSKIPILTNNLLTIKSVQYIGNYFNPSLLYHHSSLLLFQREIDKGSILSNITTNYKIINQILFDYETPLTKYESDIRMIELPNKDILLLYTDELDAPDFIFNSIRIMTRDKNTRIYSLSIPMKLDDSSLSLIEKNWVPFIYKYNVYFVKKILPLTIFKLSDEPIYKSNISYFSNRYIDSIKVDFISIDRCSRMFYLNGGEWEYGDIRGGTPAQYIPNLGYLGFFHSISVVCGRAYYMGAYVFSHSIPFHMLKMSHQPIINDLLFTPHSQTTNKYHWNVLFPMSFYLEDNQGNIIKDLNNIIPTTVVISAGVDDTYGVIIRLDYQTLLDSLSDVVCG